jgi:hypothetical protein
MSLVPGSGSLSMDPLCGTYGLSILELSGRCGLVRVQVVGCAPQR